MESARSPADDRRLRGAGRDAGEVFSRHGDLAAGSDRKPACDFSGRPVGRRDRRQTGRFVEQLDSGVRSQPGMAQLESRRR